MDLTMQRLLLRANPWLANPDARVSLMERHLPENYLHRRIEGEIARRIATEGRAILVTGPRQSGKSTLIWRCLANLDDDVLFIQCEEPLIREGCRSPILFLDDVRTLFPTVRVLFFEEVQRLAEPGLFLKGLVDARAGLSILATGSSAFEMASLTRESMAGRSSRFELLPFSIAEIAPKGDDAANRERQREVLLRAVIVGGYPAAWLSDDSEGILTDLMSALVLRDASDLARLQRPDALRRLVGLVANQIGNLVNLAEWASLCGIDAKTVDAYLFVLEQTHILRRVAVYAGGRRRELTSTPKVYFLDNGIRNVLSGGFGDLGERPDKGPVLENWVFTELCKECLPGTDLRYWRTRSGAEVDFVLITPHGLTGLEVKASELRRPELSASARSFIEAYRPRDFAVVNLAISCNDTLGDTTLRWILPWELGRFLDGIREDRRSKPG